MNKEQTTVQPALFPSPDAAWLAQVRADAERQRRHWNVNERPALLLKPEYRGSLRWVCRHPASGDIIGGVWPDYDSAILWRALALGIAQWHLVPDVATARREWGAELDAVEARLRRAVGGTA